MENEQKNEQSGDSVTEPVISSEDNSPKSLSEFLDYLKVSWQLYKKHWQRLVGISLVPFLAFFTGGAIVFALIMAGILSRGLEKPFFIGVIIIAFIGILSVIIAVIAISIISQAGLFIMIKDNTENLSVKDAFLRGKKYALGFFLLNLLIAVFIMLWSLLLIIPGIYAAVTYSAALWVYLCEGKKGRAAIKRSKELVRGYWWGVAFRYILIYALIYALMGISGFVLGKMINEAFSVIVIQIISFLIAPFFVIYSYGIYFDLLRVKKN